MIIKKCRWVNRKNPQCQHVIDRTKLTPHYKEYLDNRVKERGLDAEHCGKFATHEVDGVYLCAQHAGAKALEFLSQDKVKIILTAKSKNLAVK